MGRELMLAEKEVLNKLINGEISQRTAYEALLELGHDEDSAYAEVYNIDNEEDDYQKDWMGWN